jgi:hypothetical protein
VNTSMLIYVTDRVDQSFSKSLRNQKIKLQYKHTVHKRNTDKLQFVRSVAIKSHKTI